MILHPESHRREKLAALLWGDTSDSQARASLRNALGILRTHFGDTFLISTRDQTQLNPQYPLWVDVREFENAVRTSPQAAVQLYHGPLLLDSYDDWVMPERDVLHGKYVDTLLRLCQQMRALGEHQRTIEFSHLVLKADPANEPAHQHLMFSYAALGNRTAALRQYNECKRLLEVELGVAPGSETTALYLWIQRTPPEHTNPVSSLTNLPILLTGFVGRRAEVQSIKEILSNSRLLTISGAAGSGKTRLAIQAANEMAVSFPDGVWWIDLAALDDERLVATRLAGTLGIPDAGAVTVTEVIMGRLRTSKTLLVFDNCEHLISACAQLVTLLLTACPTLKIMITSRETLGVLGERVWRAPTMSVPDARALAAADDLMEFDSIRLFVERAIAIRPDFTPDQSNVTAVAEICRRLDGIPLAIEMAAARVSSLSIQDIAARLDERFNLLTTGDRTALPRQQTLRATMDWSFNLLSSDEQDLLCQLSVFAGGFTLEAAESVCTRTLGPQNQVVDLLSRLITKSLVTIEARSGQPRFRMLETVLEYAREKLEKTGDADAVREHHLEYFLALAERTAPALWGAVEQVRLRQLEAEQDNMSAALQYSWSHDLGEQNMRLAVSLTWFWYVRSDATQGLQWLEQALAMSAPLSIPDSLRAYALQDAGIFALMESDHGRAAVLFEESMRLFQALRDLRQVAWTFHQLGQLALAQGDYSLANERSTQSLNVFEQINDQGGAANLKTYLGLIAYYQGNTSRARALLEESLPILQEIGDVIATARAWLGLALTDLKQGNHDRAGILFKECLLAAQQIGAQLEVIRALEGLGAVAYAQDRATRSARLLGAAGALRVRIKSRAEPGLRGENDRTLAALQLKLDKQAFAKAWEEGTLLTLDQAVELALHTEPA
ncbi:MAG TPA: BTAD domain-containing putative transcriptional regulator [Anaerolineales bacterium]